MQVNGARCNIFFYFLFKKHRSCTLFLNVCTNNCIINVIFIISLSSSVVIVLCLTHNKTIYGLYTVHVAAFHLVVDKMMYIKLFTFYL